MDKKNFKMIDEGFTCNNCKKEVKPLLYTARDHCPFCLHSIHVDNNPGDRECTCHGDLVPIGVLPFKNTYKIVYKCSRCGMIKKNIVAADDNIDLIIKLSTNPVNY